MKNDKILQNYQAEVLELFKSHYTKMCTKSLNLEFSHVLQAVLTELGMANPPKTEIIFLEEWFENIHNQKFIKNIFTNEFFNEIIFHSNSMAQTIYNSQKKIIPINGISPDDYQLSFEIFALKNNISWNFSEPFASFSTSINNHEIRLTLVHYSTSANNKSKAFFRAIQKDNPTLEIFKENDNIKNFLIGLIKEKKNILVSGSTGSGKTTFLRALLSEINTEEHIIVLEDTHEIMTFSPNQTSFLSNPNLANKSLKDYCAYALRMSPDRLIIGEMRSNEVVPFMLAMNTGHTGLMSTIHANSGIDALSRLSLLFSLYSGNLEIGFNLIMRLACKNIHYVVHMENKRVKEICRIIGSEGELPFYEKIYENTHEEIACYPQPS